MQARGEVDEGGISWGDERAEGGAEDEEHDECESEEGQGIAAHESEGGGHGLSQGIASEGENRARDELFWDCELIGDVWLSIGGFLRVTVLGNLGRASIFRKETNGV